MELTPNALLKSLFGSWYNSNSHPFELTNGFNFDVFLESSILIAMTFTLVSSCQSSYISVIASSSLIQFLHHNAQKLIIIGLPSFSNVDVLIVFLPKF